MQVPFFFSCKFMMKKVEINGLMSPKIEIMRILSVSLGWKYDEGSAHW